MRGNTKTLIFPMLTAMLAVPYGVHADAPVASIDSKPVAGIAASINQLTDAQMDTVTAGQLLGAECPGCTLVSSSSMSANGVTTGTSSTGVTPGAGGGGSNGGSTGGGGNSGGGAGNGNGNGTGSTGGSTGPSGPTGPSVLTSTPALPANLAAIIAAAATSTISKP